MRGNTRIREDKERERMGEKRGKKESKRARMGWRLGREWKRANTQRNARNMQNGEVAPIKLHFITNVRA